MNFTPAEQKRILDVKTQMGLYIERKLDELEHLEQAQSLLVWISHNFVVSGGMSASIFTGTAVKDIDLYYQGGMTTAEYQQLIEQNFIADNAPFKHFVKDINPAYMKGEVEGKLITVNAVTLINDMQIIRLGHVDECRKIFDFKHCLPVYDISKQVYYISRNQFDSINSQTLMTHHGTPKSHRLDKFLKRGWRI
jgi:hypothetical protein